MADRPRTPRGGGPRREWNDRDRQPRPRRDFGERPRPDDRGDRPRFDDRGDRPRRDLNDQPRRDYADRPRRDFSDDRPRPQYGQDRPRGDFGDRPQRKFGARPPGPRRDFGARPPGPRRDFGARPPGPQRSVDDRPRGASEARPRRDFEDRPRREFEDRGERPRYEDRPRRFEDRGQRPPFDGPRPERRFDRPRPGLGPRPVRSFDTRRPPRVIPAPDTGDLRGEGEELIAGKRPVEEAFAARRDAVRLLIVPERRAALDALAIHATTLRIPVVELEGGSLTSLAGFDGHQGVALVVKPRVQADVAAILAHARQRNSPPFILVLDSLEDPQNFGSLLRSAEACGVDGVIYPTRRAAPLSPAAIKASAGATEHLLLAPVDDLAATLADLHSDGLRVVGADESASLSYAEADLRGPLALVVGSEGKGMSGPVKRRLDVAVRIPMRGKIESLNAAVAGSVLLFAAAQQRPEAVTQSQAADRSDTSDSADISKAAVKPKRAANRKAKIQPRAASDEELLRGDP